MTTGYGYSDVAPYISARTTGDRPGPAEAGCGLRSKSCAKALSIWWAGAGRPIYAPYTGHRKARRRPNLPTTGRTSDWASTGYTYSDNHLATNPTPCIGHTLLIRWLLLVIIGLFKRVTVLWLVTARFQVRLRAGALAGNDFGQVVHTHAPLFTKQYNLVPVKRRWRSAAGKVTVGLVSHWTCVTGSVVYPPTGSTAIESDMSTPLTPQYGDGNFTTSPCHTERKTASLTWTC